MLNYDRLKREIPFKWRVQSLTDYNATVVAYIDSRDVQNLLDEVVGPENWTDEYKLIDGKLFCTISIDTNVSSENTNSPQRWVSKTDCGVESNTEKEKGEASDAFKRAAVKWGVGRFLYEMPLQKIKVKKHTNGKTYPCDDSGNILWDGDMLTDHVNSKIKVADSKPNPEKYEKPAEPPQYSNPGKPNWGASVLDRATKVSKDGLKGSAALIKYLPQFNEKMKTGYKAITDLDTDKKLEDLIRYVEDLPPNGLV